MPSSGFHDHFKVCLVNASWGVAGNARVTFFFKKNLSQNPLNPFSVATLLTVNRFSNRVCAIHKLNDDVENGCSKSSRKISSNLK